MEGRNRCGSAALQLHDGKSVGVQCDAASIQRSAVGIQERAALLGIGLRLFREVDKDQLPIGIREAVEREYRCAGGDVFDVIVLGQEVCARPEEFCKEFLLVDAVVDKLQRVGIGSAVFGSLPIIFRRFIALDFETTGLSPAKERIVEIGAVLFFSLVGFT